MIPKPDGSTIALEWIRFHDQDEDGFMSLPCAQGTGGKNLCIDNKDV